ncbi:MAG: hypothetical protein ABH889_02315 [Candidatus Portnoybacteria bacterium]
MKIKSGLKIAVSILFISGGFFILPSLALADSLGDQNTFFVDSTYDVSGRTQVAATMRAIGENAYFYLEDDYYQKLNGTYKNAIREELETLADEFDNVVYPKLRTVYGSEWNPGIDQDSRITILFTELVNDAGGYFNAYDEFSRSEISNSNEREMIYFNALNVFNPKNKALLAHEFQHLITFYQKTVIHGLEDDIWLNEARSEYAPTICGYNNYYPRSYLSDRVDTFLDYPTEPLAEWKNNISDYGAINLFMHYLVDHYGQGILTRMILSNKVGIESINFALSSLGYSKTFADVFADWSVANYLNDCQIGQGQYCYLNKNLTPQRLSVDYSASYSGFPSLIVSRSSSVKDWSPRWYRFRQGGTTLTDKDALKLEFDASADLSRSNFRVPYIITDQNNNTTVHNLSLEGQRGTAYISDFNELDKTVVLIPINQNKDNKFTNSDPLSLFSFTASSISDDSIPGESDSAGDLPGPQVNYPEGSLLRAKGDYRVYIIKGNYRRWIQKAEIFNQYQHFKWEDIIDVEPSVMNQYQDAWLIRADNDKKVYEVNGDGTKHWLNMTAEEFTISGRKWDMVYIVNSFERDSYSTGSNVMFK